MKNFTIEAEDNTFEFYSMNRREPQLFYVYVQVNGNKVRFHMQLDRSTGNFFITDKVHCPPQYHQSEQLFSDAIKIYGRLDKIPT
jgi:hypothetical protein